MRLCSIELRMRTHYSAGVRMYFLRDCRKITITESVKQVGTSFQMFPPVFMPVSGVQTVSVLSTPQTPIALPHSQKTPVSPEAGQIR